MADVILYNDTPALIRVTKHAIFLSDMNNRHVLAHISQHQEIKGFQLYSTQIVLVNYGDSVSVYSTKHGFYWLFRLKVEAFGFDAREAAIVSKQRTFILKDAIEYHLRTNEIDAAESWGLVYQLEHKSGLEARRMQVPILPVTEPGEPFRLPDELALPTEFSFQLANQWVVVSNSNLTVAGVTYQVGEVLIVYPTADVVLVQTRETSYLVLRRAGLVSLRRRLDVNSVVVVEGGGGLILNCTKSTQFLSVTSVDYHLTSMAATCVGRASLSGEFLSVFHGTTKSIFRKTLTRLYLVEEVPNVKMPTPAIVSTSSVKFNDDIPFFSSINTAILPENESSSPSLAVKWAILKCRLNSNVRMHLLHTLQSKQQWCSFLHNTQRYNLPESDLITFTVAKQVRDLEFALIGYKRGGVNQEFLRNAIRLHLDSMAELPHFRKNHCGIASTGSAEQDSMNNLIFLLSSSHLNAAALKRFGVLYSIAVYFLGETELLLENGESTIEKAMRFDVLFRTKSLKEAYSSLKNLTCDRLKVLDDDLIASTFLNRLIIYDGDQRTEHIMSDAHEGEVNIYNHFLGHAVSSSSKTSYIMHSIWT